MSSYKGNDLDLRVGRGPAGLSEGAGPRLPAGAGMAWDPFAAERARAQGVAGSPQSGPIAVDELLLSCCNGAHDVAQFHGASAVRIEHLLYALTRNRAAADGLSALGIGPDALRRETAVAVASEGGPPPLAGAPAASAALEDALRRAAELGALRRSPACLPDLLRALLQGGPASPAAILLLNAAVDPQQLERWRDQPLTIGPGVSPDGPHLSAAVQNLNGRLDRLEASLRALSGELAEAVKSLMAGLLATEGELRALRAEPSGGVLIPNHSAPIDGVAQKLAEIGHTMAALGERVALLNAPVAGDGAGDLQRSLAAVEARLSEQNGTLARTLSQSLGESLTARLEAVEGGLEGLKGELERVAASSEERHIGLQASVRAQLDSAEEASKARGRDLTEIHEALVKLGTSQRTLGDNLSTWQLENSGDVGILSNRLQQLEHNSIELLTRVGNEVAALGRDAPSPGFWRGLFLRRWLTGPGKILPRRRKL
jgi:hypothetical protein